MKKTLIFDVFGTLLHFKDDETLNKPWAVLSEFFAGYGASVLKPQEIKERWQVRVDAYFLTASPFQPDIDMTLVYEDLTRDLVFQNALFSQESLTAIAKEAAWEFRQAATVYRSAYEGTHEALAELKEDYRLVLANNTQRVYTERELQAERLWHYFNYALFSSDVGRVKPSPVLFEKVLEDLNIKPSETVYIGDNPVDDYVASKAIGMPLILLRHDGNTNHAELGIPKSIPIVTSFPSLVSLIKADY